MSLGFVVEILGNRPDCGSYITHLMDIVGVFHLVRACEIIKDEFLIVHLLVFLDSRENPFEIIKVLALKQFFEA